MKKALLIASVLGVCMAATTSHSGGPLNRPDVLKDAEIVAVSGDSWVRFLKKEDWLHAFRDQVLTAGDLLKTGEYGRMGVLFVDGIQIKVSRKTVLAIKEVRRGAQRKSTILGVEVGEVWSRAKAVPEGLRIETPSATAAIRGTDWHLLVDAEGTSTVAVLQGSVSFFNDYGSLVVEQGQQAVAEVGKPPVKSFLVRPRERVQWVFSYPMDVAKLVSFHSHRREEVLRALPSVREKAERDPSDAASRLFLAGLLFDAGQMEESLRLFDEVLDAEPDNARALAFRGLLALEKGETDQAAAYFEGARRSGRGDAPLEALLGEVGVHLRKGKIAEAANLLNELRQSESRAVVGVVASVFEAFVGNFTNAVEVAAAYAAKYPEDERFPILIASFQTVLDEGEKALDAAQQGLKLYPHSSPAYGVLAGIYHLEGRGKEAEAAYRKAIELDPANATARNGLALLRMEKGDYEEAEEQVSQALEAVPENPMLRANRGILFTMMEKLKKAQEDYGKALEQDPTHYVALNGLGLAALKEGRTEEAIRNFLKSSLLEPGFAQPHSFLAIAYYQLGETQGALEELALARQLDPKDPFPHLVAYLIYQDTYRPFQAVEEAQKVLELLPYLKSVEEIENTKIGLSNLGSALLGFGLADWAESYA